jgi:hypothetical protein
MHSSARECRHARFEARSLNRSEAHLPREGNKLRGPAIACDRSNRQAFARYRSRLPTHPAGNKTGSSLCAAVGPFCISGKNTPQFRTRSRSSGIERDRAASSGIERHRAASSWIGWELIAKSESVACRFDSRQSFPIANVFLSSMPLGVAIVTDFCTTLCSATQS